VCGERGGGRGARPRRVRGKGEVLFCAACGKLKFSPAHVFPARPPMRRPGTPEPCPPGLMKRRPCFPGGLRYRVCTPVAGHGGRSSCVPPYTGAASFRPTRRPSSPASSPRFTPTPTLTPHLITGRRRHAARLAGPLLCRGVRAVRGRCPGFGRSGRRPPLQAPRVRGDGKAEREAPRTRRGGGRGAGARGCGGRRAWRADLRACAPVARV